MKDIIFEYRDDDGKELKLSQNGKSGGIMVSQKIDGKYRMIFHTMSSKSRCKSEQELVEWYKNFYKPLSHLIREQPQGRV